MRDFATSAADELAPAMSASPAPLLQSRDFRALFVSSFLVDLGLCLYFFLFSLFLVEHHFPVQRIGLITASLTLGTVAGTIPASLLARRYGLRPVMLTYVLAAPLLLASRTIFFQTPAQLLLGFLGGVAMSLWNVCFLPTVARLTSKHNRTFGFSIFVTLGIGSAAIAGIIGGYLPGLVTNLGGHHGTDGIRVVLLLACGVISLAASGLIRLRPDAPVPTSTPDSSSFLTRFLIAAALWSFALNFFTSFSSVYLARELHLPLAHIGTIYSICQVAQVAMVMLAPLLYRRVGVLLGIAMTQMIAGVLMFSLAHAHNLNTAVPLYVSLAAAQWMSGPGISALLMNHTRPAQRGQASAAYNIANMAAGAAATMMAGRAFQCFGFGGPLRADASMAVVAALLWFVLLRGHRSETEESKEGVPV